MSIFKSDHLAITSFIAFFGLPCSALLAGESGGHWGGGGSISSTAEREIIRRQERVAAAEDGEIAGDKLVSAEDFEGGIGEFKTALDTLPRAPLTQPLRDRITQKYGDASVKLAYQRANEGRYDDSINLLENVLNPKVDPENPEALKLLEDLKDPEKYSPAMTPEHYARVQNVERLLKIGWSEYNLGKFDAATATYMKILQEDPYNKAARRKMTVIEDAKADYYRTAYNHTRAKMLSDVDKLWEIPVPPSNIGGPVNGGPIGGDPDGIGYNAAKLRDIIIPKISFKDATLEEAVEFLRIQSVELDTLEDDPRKKGVNIVIRQSGAVDEEAQPKINISLSQVPLGEALRYITELAGLKYKIEPFSVVVVPLSDVSEELYTKVFRVPPTFLAIDGDAGGGDAGAASDDPFADDSNDSGAGLSKRPTAKDILAKRGVTFSEGASAFFNPNSSQLVIRNTQRNMELIEAFVVSIFDEVPKQVFITTKFVEVSQNNLDELGFDWLLGAFNLPSSNRVFGSGGTPGNSANQFAATDFPFTPPVADASAIGGNPLTAGLRSGSNAIQGNAVDSLLGGVVDTATSALSPGIFGLAGVFTDPQFQVVIRALNQRRGADLLSAPSVTTRSGQRAKIEIIREFIYPTEYDPPEIPQNFGETGSTTGGGGLIAGNTGASVSAFPVTPSTPTAFETRNLGVTLEVDPVIGADGFTIDLNLAPEVVEFEGFINYGSPIQTSGVNAFGQPVTVTLTENKIEMPIFSTRRVTTAVTIWDGQTVAIGGLIREDIQQTEDKVPLLGDLPLIGRLFRSETEQHLKRNLMVFVTAKLIDPAGRSIKTSDTTETATPTAAPTANGADNSLFPSP